MDELVERSRAQAALWDEVKDKLKQNALSCPAASSSGSASPGRSPSPRRDPDGRALLGLDPVSTGCIEDLMEQLKDYTIVIVTHNMQQAARVSDRTAFFTAEAAEGTGDRTGCWSSTTAPTDLHPAGRQADRGLRHRSFR